MSANAAQRHAVRHAGARIEAVVGYAECAHLNLAPGAAVVDRARAFVARLTRCAPYGAACAAVEAWVRPAWILVFALVSHELRGAVAFCAAFTHLYAFAIVFAWVRVANIVFEFDKIKIFVQFYLINIELPNSHRVPVVPTGHRHLNAVPSATHFPPFKQLFKLHATIGT